MKVALGAWFCRQLRSDLEISAPVFVAPVRSDQSSLISRVFAMARLSGPFHAVHSIKVNKHIIQIAVGEQWTGADCSNPWHTTKVGVSLLYFCIT